MELKYGFVGGECPNRQIHCFDARDSDGYSRCYPLCEWQQEELWEDRLWSIHRFAFRLGSYFVDGQ